MPLYQDLHFAQTLVIALEVEAMEESDYLFQCHDARAKQNTRALI